MQGAGGVVVGVADGDGFEVEAFGVGDVGEHVHDFLGLGFVEQALVPGVPDLGAGHDGGGGVDAVLGGAGADAHEQADFGGGGLGEAVVAFGGAPG